MSRSTNRRINPLQFQAICCSISRRSRPRLLVLSSDAYHIAVAKADECVTNALAFIKEAALRT